MDLPGNSPSPSNPRASSVSAFIVALLVVLFCVMVYRLVESSNAQRRNGGGDGWDGANPLIEVGSTAPDFTLRDAQRDPDDPASGVTLSQITDNHPVLLLYFLGYSCPRCVEHLRHMADRIGEFNTRGVQILAICPNTVAELRDSIHSYGGLPFPILADPDYKAAFALNLVDLNEPVMIGLKNGAVQGTITGRDLDNIQLKMANGQTMTIPNAEIEHRDYGVEHGAFIIDTHHKVTFVYRGGEPYDGIDDLIQRMDAVKIKP